MLRGSLGDAWKVGLFVVLGAIAAHAMYVFVGGRGLFGDRGYTVQALIPDATCLSDGARVQVAGVPVGRVVKRELDPGGGARLTLRIDDSRLVIHEDAAVRKRSVSLLGECSLELDPGHPARDEDHGASR